MKAKYIIVLLVFTVVCGFWSTRLQAKDVQKRFEVEASAGFSRMAPGDLYNRAAAIENVISLYTDYYHLSYSSTGKFSANSNLIPINFSVNYHFNKKWFLKAGIDFSSSNQSASRSFQVNWTGFNETHDYNVSDKLSLVMPHLGAGYRHRTFDFYGALGLGFANVTHTETLDYTEPGYQYATGKTYKINGSSLGFILGVKYRLKLGKKTTGHSLYAFIKLEALMLNISSLDGKKHESGNNSNGEHFSQQTSGTVYAYDWLPYSTGSVSYWDLFLAEPTSGGEIRNPEKLTMSYSTLRLMIGFSF